jgi:phosphonate transport system substrate-binding protein
LPQPLRVATFLAPGIRPLYERVTEAVADRLGRDAELVVGSSFDQFDRREFDAGFICGLPYVELTRRAPSPVFPIAGPVLRGARYAGRPVYFSDVIVRRESDVTAFADLRGRSWAYNDRDSHSGYNLTRYHLVQRGETRGFFGRVVEAGFHDRAVRLVAEGEVDAAAIDSQVLAVELANHPELARAVRIVATLGPSTIQPLVVSRHLPAEMIATIRDVVLSMHDDAESRPVLAASQVERFAPVKDADYDDIRQMLRTVEEAGFLTLR